MIKAAELADQIGKQQLAQKIRKEAEGYADASRLRAIDIENRFCDVAFERPDLSFESILSGVAAELGLTSEELLRRWPTAPRRGFDEAKKWSAQSMRPQ